MKTIIFGQKHFACEVARLIMARPGWQLCAISAPPGDRLAKLAADHQIPLLGKARALTAAYLRHVCRDNTPDLIVTAHCHDFIPAHIRNAAAHGAIGYHPSLLPLRRGRHAIPDTIREGDKVTGGTIYRLDDGWDTGPILTQRHAFVKATDTPRTLWRDTLAPLGLELFAEAFDLLAATHASEQMG